MRKRAICLEVAYLSENLETIGIGYIIDIEVRFPKPKVSKHVDDSGKPKTTQSIGSTSMVLVWRAGQTLQDDGEANKISDYDFREILKAIAAHGGYKGAKEHFPQGCLTQARKHSANGISFDKLLEELRVCVLSRESGVSQ